jgi:hypothetical protein
MCTRNFLFEIVVESAEFNLRCLPAFQHKKVLLIFL